MRYTVLTFLACLSYHGLRWFYGSSNGEAGGGGLCVRGRKAVRVREVLCRRLRVPGGGGNSGAAGERYRFFAFHIHEGGDCGGTDFSDTGGHFNPEKQAHPRHAGDLPPLLSDHGTATLLVQTSRFTPGEVIGRTVVIHQNPDDFHSQSAGRKIACGMIRRA